LSVSGIGLLVERERGVGGWAGQGRENKREREGSDLLVEGGSEGVKESEGERERERGRGRERGARPARRQ